MRAVLARLFFILLLVLKASSLALGDDLITVANSQIINKNFVGFGAEWDSIGYPVNGVNEEDFNTISSRVSSLKMPVCRIMVLGSWCYLGGGKYNWNSDSMKWLYKQLDLCQRQGIKVILCSWGAGGSAATSWLNIPGITGPDDPQYAQVIGAIVDYLVNTKGYSCIKYFSAGNEPDLELANNWPMWKNLVVRVNAEFTKRGLDRKVTFSGPEVSQGQHGDTWLSGCGGQLPDIMGAYSVHNYATRTDVKNGIVENLFLQKRQLLRNASAVAASMPIFVSEAGMQDDQVLPSGNRHIAEVDYGIFMADYGVQAARSGVSSVLAWMLEDNGHKDFFWGMWSDKKSGMYVRPWASSWSLLTRYFPYSSTIYRVQQPNMMRILVARVPAKSNLHSLDYSLCLVNRDTTTHNVNVNLAIAKAELRTFKHYVYSDSAVATDPAFPNLNVSTEIYNTKRPITIACPPNSVTVLTTM
ncbi:hypothetical protein L4X63_18585 [Geomonas sp. Red32]|uniref:hypothetical protein n=1 Tax=Geomonas sp. Red32 TaxID=2912856 RepID=UPI00202D061F|nr:hypothetical protein [Geomonas sp. Red32]MCM0083597.1 hypothetical protein [Geomonas sp. Red32]